MIMEAVCIEEYVVALLFPVNLPFSLSQANIVIFSNKNIPRYPFATAQRPLQQPHPSASTSTRPYHWRERESATASPLSKQLDFELKRARLFDGVEINVSNCIQAPVINQLVVAYSVAVWMRQMPFVSSDKASTIYIISLQVNTACLFVVASPIMQSKGQCCKEAASPKADKFRYKRLTDCLCLYVGCVSDSDDGRLSWRSHMVSKRGAADWLRRCEKWG